MIRVHVHARDHEAAHVASVQMTLQPAEGLAALAAQLERELRVTVRWAEEQALLIGHVKAYLRWNEIDARMLSTTGGPVEQTGSPLPGQEPEFVELGVTAIVFGGTLEAAEERVLALAAVLVGQQGDWCSCEHECEHHHDHAHDHAHANDHEHGHDHDHVHPAGGREVR